jgi:hypothetical protein
MNITSPYTKAIESGSNIRASSRPARYPTSRAARTPTRSCPSTHRCMMPTGARVQEEIRRGNEALMVGLMLTDGYRVAADQWIV